MQWRGNTVRCEARTRAWAGGLSGSGGACQLRATEADPLLRDWTTRLVQLRRDDRAGAVIEPAGVAQEIDIVGDEAVAPLDQPRTDGFAISARAIDIEHRTVSGLEGMRRLLDKMEKPIVAFARQRSQVGAVGNGAFDAWHQPADRVELVERIIKLIRKPLAVQPRSHDLGQQSVIVVQTRVEKDVIRARKIATQPPL